MSESFKLLLWFFYLGILICSTNSRKTKPDDDNASLFNDKSKNTTRSISSSSTEKPFKDSTKKRLPEDDDSIADDTTASNETSSKTADKKSTNNTDNNKFVPGLTQQRFLQIDGYEIPDLLKSTKYPQSPDEVNAITNVNLVDTDDVNKEDAEERIQSFGERIFGFFKAPQTGNYVFKISSKATSQFSISQTDKPAGLRTYASVKGREIVEPNDYDKYSKQKSIPISFKANEMYYFEVLHKVLYGVNHVQLGATFPDNSEHYPLQESYFYSMKALDKQADALGGGGGGGGGAGGGAGGGGGGAGGGGGGAGGGGAGDGNGGGDGGENALKAAYDAGLLAGQQKGKNAGENAGKEAGKYAGEDAGGKAGAEAGLKAAADALGISVEQLQQQKINREAAKKGGLKLRIYSGNFKCSKPGGHVCKYALSAQEDSSIRLNPREAATTFILRKPGLNGDVQSASFELDGNRGAYLVKDGSKFVVSINDGSKSLAGRASFILDREDEMLSSTYGLKLFDRSDLYLCHQSGTSDVVVDKVSANCAFHIVPPELDMNALEDSCQDYCADDDSAGPKLASSDAPQMSPTEKQASTTETLHLLNALAKHAAYVAAEKLAERTRQKMAAEHNLLHDHTYYAALHAAAHTAHDENIHDESHDSTDVHGKEFIILHFKNKVGTSGDVRIISSIKPEGYVLGSDVFKLKVVFKYKYVDEVTFHAIDESGKGREILLNGKKKLTFQPTASTFDYSDIIVSTTTTKVDEVHNEHEYNEHPLGDHLIHPSSELQTNEHHMDLTLSNTTHFLAHDTSKPYYPTPGSSGTPGSLLPVNMPPAVAQETFAQTPLSTTLSAQPILQQTAFQKDQLPDVVEIAFDDDNSSKKTITEIHMNKPQASSSLWKLQASSSLWKPQKSSSLWKPQKSSSLWKPQASIINSASQLKDEPPAIDNGTRKSLLLANDDDIYMFKNVNPYKSKENEVGFDAEQNIKRLVDSEKDLKDSKGYKKIPEPKQEKSYAKNSYELNKSEEDKTSDSDFHHNNDNEFTFDVEDDGYSSKYNSTKHVRNTSNSTIKNNTIELIKPGSEIFNNENESSTNDKEHGSDGHTSRAFGSHYVNLEPKLQATVANNKIISEDQGSLIQNVTLPLETGQDIFNMFKKDESPSLISSHSNSTIDQSQLLGPLRSKALEEQVQENKNILKSLKNLTSDEKSKDYALNTGVSEKKTIMKSVPVKIATSNMHSRNDEFVEKKHLLDALKTLEENTYRAKLKTLSDFLKEYTNSDKKQLKRYNTWLTTHNHPKSWYYGVPVTGLKRSPIPHVDPLNSAQKKVNFVHEDDDFVAQGRSFLKRPLFDKNNRGLPLHDDKRYTIPLRIQSPKSLQYLRKKLASQYLWKKEKILKNYLEGIRKQQLAKSAYFRHMRLHPLTSSQLLARRNLISYAKKKRLNKINWLKKNYCRCPSKCISASDYMKCQHSCELKCLKPFVHKIKKRDLENTETADYIHKASKGRLSTKVAHHRMRRSLSTTYNNASNEEVKKFRENAVGRRMSSSWYYSLPKSFKKTNIESESKSHRRKQQFKQNEKRSSIQAFNSPSILYKLKLPQIPKLAVPINLASPASLKYNIPSNTLAENAFQKNIVPKMMDNGKALVKLYSKNLRFNHTGINKPRIRLNKSLYPPKIQTKIASNMPKLNSYKPLFDARFNTMSYPYIQYSPSMYNMPYSMYNIPHAKTAPALYNSQVANSFLPQKSLQPQWPPLNAPPSLQPKNHNTMYTTPSYKFANIFRNNSLTNLSNKNINYKNFQNIMAAKRIMYYQLQKYKQNSMRPTSVKYRTLPTSVKPASKYTLPKSKTNSAKQLFTSIYQKSYTNNKQAPLSQKFLIPYKPLRNFFPALNIFNQKSLYTVKNKLNVPKSSIPTVSDVSGYGRWTYPSKQPKFAPMVFYPRSYTYPTFVQPTYTGEGIANVLRAKYVYNRALHNYMMRNRNYQELKRYNRVNQYRKQQQNKLRGVVPVRPLIVPVRPVIVPVRPVRLPVRPVFMQNNRKQLSAMKNVPAKILPKAKNNKVLAKKIVINNKLNVNKKKKQVRRIITKVKVISDDDSSWKSNKFKTVTGNRRSLSHSNVTNISSGGTNNETITQGIDGNETIRNNGTSIQTFDQGNNETHDNNTLVAVGDKTHSDVQENVTKETPDQSSISEEINEISYLHDDENSSSPLNTTKDNLDPSPLNTTKDNLDPRLLNTTKNNTDASTLNTTKDNLDPSTLKATKNNLDPSTLNTTKTKFDQNLLNSNKTIPDHSSSNRTKNKVTVITERETKNGVKKEKERNSLFKISKSVLVNNSTKTSRGNSFTKVKSKDHPRTKENENKISKRKENFIGKIVKNQNNSVASNKKTKNESKSTGYENIIADHYYEKGIDDGTKDGMEDSFIMKDTSDDSNRKKNQTVKLLSGAKHSFNNLLNQLVKGDNISTSMRNETVDPSTKSPKNAAKKNRKILKETKQIEKERSVLKKNQLKEFRSSSRYKAALDMLSKSGIPFYIHKPFRGYMGFKGIHSINSSDTLVRRNTTMTDLREEFEKFINHEEDRGNEEFEKIHEELIEEKKNKTNRKEHDQNEANQNVTKYIYENDEPNKISTNVSSSIESRDQNKTVDHKFNHNVSTINLQVKEKTNSTKTENCYSKHEGMKNCKKVNSETSPPNKTATDNKSDSNEDKKKTSALEEAKLEIEREEKEREKEEEQKDTAAKQKKKLRLKNLNEVSILKKVKDMRLHKSSTSQTKDVKNTNVSIAKVLDSNSSAITSVANASLVGKSASKPNHDQVIQKQLFKNISDIGDEFADTVPPHVQKQSPMKEAKNESITETQKSEPVESESLNPTAISTPNEIEALYSDRVDNSNNDMNLVSSKNDNYNNFDEYKPSVNHDTMYGDWFDFGFRPDTVTKQDLKMSKSKFLSKLLAKQKQQETKKVEDKFLYYSPTVKQVEDKINYIVKNEETNEQSELQNLIKESMGTGSLGEGSELSAISKEYLKRFSKNDNPADVFNDSVTSENKTHPNNLTVNKQLQIKPKHAKLVSGYPDDPEYGFNVAYLDKGSVKGYEGKSPIKQFMGNDDTDMYLENEVIKSKGDNNDIEKILSDYKDELSLSDQESNDGLFDNMKEKGDVLNQVKEQNRKEIENLRQDLGETISQHHKEASHLLAPNKLNVSEPSFEELAADKKSVENEDQLKNNSKTLLRHAMKNINEATNKVKSAVEEQIRKFRQSSGNMFKAEVKKYHDDLEGKIGASGSEPIVGGSKKSSNIEKLGNQGNQGLQLIKEKWMKIRNENFADDAKTTNTDLLTQYFQEVEEHQDSNKTEEMSDRQERRQRQIKATLGMINDLEHQIDQMIVVSDKRGDGNTTKKLEKLKKKGKAAIFKELLNGKLKHSDDDDEEEEDGNLVSSNEKHKSAGKSEEINQGNDNDESEGENLQEDEDQPADLTKNDDAEEQNDGKYEKNSMADDDSDIGPPRKHVKVLHVTFKDKSRGSSHDNDNDDFNIINDIASKDKKVSMDQAEALMNIQKQEVNQDLLKLKEVTQDGLQTMFAHAVAKQQKFMDDIQGNQNVVARDQLSAEPMDDKLLALHYVNQRRQSNQPIGKDYLQPHVDLEDTNRKSHVNELPNQNEVNQELMNQHEDNGEYDDDLVDPDSDGNLGDGNNNQDESERDEYRDEDKRSVNT